MKWSLDYIKKTSDLGVALSLLNSVHKPVFLVLKKSRKNLKLARKIAASWFGAIWRFRGNQALRADSDRFIQRIGASIVYILR